MMAPDELQAHIAQQATSAHAPSEPAGQPRSLAVATGWVPVDIVEYQIARWIIAREEWENSARGLKPTDPEASERCWARAELMGQMIRQLRALVARATEHQPTPNAADQRRLPPEN